MGNRPRNRKMSAKEFFKDINEEKSDNTRVARPTKDKYEEPDERTIEDDFPHADPLNRAINHEGWIRRQKDDLQQSLMDSRNDAVLGKKVYPNDISREQKDSMDVEEGARKWNNQEDSGAHDVFNFSSLYRKQMSPDEYADVVSDQSKLYKQQSTDRNREQAENYKKLRHQASVQRGKQFERNLHQYDNAGDKGKFTKKYSDVEPPESIRRPKKSFAKSFFEGVE